MRKEREGGLGELFLGWKKIYIKIRVLLMKFPLVLRARAFRIKKQQLRTPLLA